MEKFKSVDELVSQLKPVEPIYCIRTSAIQQASKIFQNKLNLEDLGLEIAKVVGEKRGLMQNVLDFGGQPEFSVKLLKDLASTTRDRILFSMGTGPDLESGKRVRGLLKELCSEGGDITAISQPRSSGFMFCLQSGLPFAG